jgi:hypothetical protein
MFKKIMSYLKSKETGTICIGGDVKNSLIVNKTTQNQEITINGKTYKGTHIIVNNLGVFVDVVKQKP